MSRAELMLALNDTAVMVEGVLGKAPILFHFFEKHA